MDKDFDLSEENIERLLDSLLEKDNHFRLKINVTISGVRDVVLDIPPHPIFGHTTGLEKFSIDLIGSDVELRMCDSSMDKVLHIYKPIVMAYEGGKD